MTQVAVVKYLRWFAEQIIFLPCRMGFHHLCPGHANEYADSQNKLSGPVACACSCHKG